VELKKRATNFGQIIPTKVVDFRRSWSFIILFGILFCFGYQTSICTIGDSYPYFLFYPTSRLLGSCYNDESKSAGGKDRNRARRNYLMNLKSEHEIIMLHEKLDSLIKHQ
jgi:uncharacterized membrane protein